MGIIKIERINRDYLMTTRIECEKEVKRLRRIMKGWQILVLYLGTYTESNKFDYRLTVEMERVNKDEKVEC